MNLLLREKFLQFRKFMKTTCLPGVFKKGDAESVYEQSSSKPREPGKLPTWNMPT